MLRQWNTYLKLVMLFYTRGILSDVTWPDDMYGLPMPNAGCPDTPDVTWQTGWVLQDMVKESGYAHSSPLHLKSDLSNNIKRHFCMKTTSKHIYEPVWPPGKYCIYRKGGGCPLNMKSGYYQWDDEWLNNQNSQGGVYPDGIYDRNTLIYFCCRIDGDKNVPISLPTSRPFFLLAWRSKKCQQVKWALATAEWLQYDTAGSGSRGFVYPFNGYLDDPTIYYCYYQSCNITLSGDIGSVISPNYPDPVPRGQFCSWNITVAPGYQVSLKFKEFLSSGNETEQLQVYDGGNETSPILDIFTGNNPPPAFGVNSSSNNMFIILKSAVKPVVGENNAKFFAEFTKQEPPTVLTTTEAVTAATSSTARTTALISTTLIPASTNATFTTASTNTTYTTASTTTKNTTASTNTLNTTGSTNSTYTTRSTNNTYPTAATNATYTVVTSNITFTTNNKFTKITREPTKSSIQSSSILEHVTSQATEPVPTEHASGNSSARSEANTRTGNGTLAVAIVVPLVIILIVVIGLFLWKKRKNRKSDRKRMLKITYDGNKEETEVAVMNPIYELEPNDNHCFNPIYDSSTEKEVTHTALQGQLDQLCGQTGSDNPLYDTADTKPNSETEHLRGEIEQNALYSSADAIELQPDIEKKLTNQNYVSENPLYASAHLSIAI